jgi:hypothetical protein
MLPFTTKEYTVRKFSIILLFVAGIYTISAEATFGIHSYLGEGFGQTWNDSSLNNADHPIIDNSLYGAGVGAHFELIE